MLLSRKIWDIPLLLPASLKTANPRIMPKQSCVNSGEILPWFASGLCMVSFDPDAVTICCSLVPENCPRTADVIADGGCIVKLYMNIELVVAIFAVQSKTSRLREKCDEVRLN